MEDPSGLYDAFRRIPFYLELVAIFTVLQLVVVGVLGAVVALQLHRIAAILDRATPKDNGSHYPPPQPGQGPSRPY